MNFAHRNSKCSFILENVYGLCTLLIAFYNKITIKSQNDATYDRNKSIIFFFHLSGRLAHSRGMTPFRVGQNAVCPTDSDC